MAGGVPSRIFVTLAAVLGIASAAAPSCNAWHIAKRGEPCRSIADTYGLTVAQVLRFNPTASSDCAENALIDSAFCVGVEHTLSPPSLFTSSLEISAAARLKGAANSVWSAIMNSWVLSWVPTLRPTVDTSFTPTPSHGPMPSNCVNYYRIRLVTFPTDLLLPHRLLTRMALADRTPLVRTFCPTIQR